MTEQTFDFTILLKEIQKNLQPSSLRTLAKLVDVYAISSEELAGLRHDFQNLRNDSLFSMQSREFINILLNGLPLSPEPNLEAAPDCVTGSGFIKEIT